MRLQPVALVALDVVGYKKGQKNQFSTIGGNSDTLGIAASPEVKK
jgi:hypothetical protein